MKRVMNAPAKYVQGRGVLADLGAYAALFGKKGAFGIVGPSALKKYGELLHASFAGEKNFGLTLEEFAGECSRAEIERLMAEARRSGSDVIFGMGGGKAQDTAKAAAHYLEMPVMIVPSAASSDAPCSALSVIYTEAGQFAEYLVLPKNPEVVLLDSEVVAEAPVRLLVAGMGDALATFYEARACFRSGAVTMAGGVCSPTALALAAACRDLLFADGYRARLAAESRVASPALDNIMEANTYLSGLGFESGGLAACHGFHNGLTALEESHAYLHGEKVAFGVLTQLVLENAPADEFGQVLKFCRDIGLPTNLAAIGVTDPGREKIMKVAAAACAKGETTHNMSFPVTPEDMYGAIMLADKLGGA